MHEKPTIQTVTTDRFSMDYFSFGQGERELVLIPGVSVRPVTLAAGAVADAYSDMAAQWHITVIDRKKHMQSGYTISDMADDTAEAMMALGLRGVDVLGCSQGGMIAEVIAIRYPALFRKMVLASTLARGNQTSDAVFAEWRALLAAGDRQKLNRGIAARVYSEEYLKAYSRVFAFMENTGTPEELERFRLLIEACNGFDVYEELPRITCPTLVAASRRDAVVGEGPQEIAEKLGCAFRLYDGYSHAVYDEAPDFHAMLMAFFG